MALPAGARLGPYEILAPIGAGGMGEVYRAHDSRLGRDVAIKVLPATFSSNPDRLIRFEQEARAAAALNHPNILAVHDVGQHDGAPYIVSELLDGHTLRHRLGDAPLSARRAMEFASGIARGLSVAHDKGIVHRDLKPENVIVTSDGRAKILDFGLAKLIDVGVAAGVSHAPTKAAQTEAGVVLGTLGYMAPEQVRGLAVDHRADIFALGAILYEMLSGARAFTGATTADVAVAILDRDPPELPIAERHIPPSLARIVDRCLEKNPANRFQSAGDLAFALESLSSPSETMASARVDARSARRSWVAWALAATALIAALVLGIVTYVGRPVAVARSIKSTILPPPGVRVTDRGGSPARRLAISPDGERLAFTAAGSDGVISLWVRRLDSLAAQRLEGTEGAVYPFWSPDSRFIGFFAEDGKSRSKLMKIDPSGGSPIALCDLPGPNSTGGTWGRDDVILFGLFAAREGEIQRVSASGGAYTAVTTLDKTRGETRHWSPWFLPDGWHFLYLATGRTGGNPTDPNGLYVGALDSQQRTLVIAGGSTAKYANGHLIFFRSRFDGTTLMAQPFDPVSLALSGEAVPIASQVNVGGPTGVAGTFTVSETGILAYQTGLEPLTQPTWISRHGKTLGTLGESRRYGDLAISPDGSRVAMTTMEPGYGNADIWIHDVSRGVRTRFTSDAMFERGAVWSADGQRIAFVVNRSTDLTDFDMFVKPALESGEPQPLAASGPAMSTESWAPDGQFIAYVSPQLPFVGGSGDIWILPLSGDRTPTPFMQTRFSEIEPTFSPNGRWIAYVSNESGRADVYVAPFPGPGAKVQISTAGGGQPRWRRDGREIFYIGGGMMRAADVNEHGATLQVGNARALFPVPPNPLGFRLGRSYDVSADGQRFLVNVVNDTSDQPVTLVVNWTADTRK